MNYEPENPLHHLSPGGRRRKAEILSAALIEAANRRRRRQLNRSAVTAAIGVLLAGLTVLISLQPAGTPLAFWKQPIVVPVEPATTRPLHGEVAATIKSNDLATSRAVLPEVVESRPSALVIHTIRTDPAIVDRLAVRRSVGGWEVIGTEELLRQMNRVGLAGGVIVRNGKPQIWFRPAEERQSPG